MIPDDFIRDAPHPYKRRVCLPEFAGFDPRALDWRGMRKYPNEFPDIHIAKVSSLRTVVGMDVTGASGKTHRLYVKRSFTRGVWRQFLGHFRASKEWKEMQVAQAFLQAGITVPRPVYYSETTSEDLPTRFFATEALEKRWICLQTWISENGIEDDRWKALAKWTRELHDRMILHADYRADHVYIDPNEGTGQWALIDLDGSRTGRPVTPRERHRALLQLVQSLVPGGINLIAIRSLIAAYDEKNRWGFSAESLLETARKNIRNRPPKTK